MTLVNAIKILEEYNRWRRGEDIPQPNPKLVGEAIDFAINQLKQIR